MKNLLLILVWLFSQRLGISAEFKEASPGFEFVFPQDHYAHGDYKTEWWYFTGNLHDKSGRAFGYQLTFFRQGIRPGKLQTQSRWVRNDFYFAHFALADVESGVYKHFQAVSRGAFGDAGLGKLGDARIVWNGDWTLDLLSDGDFRIAAKSGDVAIDLNLHSQKPIVIHGENGVSKKGSNPGQASHYYSFTRMKTSGSIRTKEDHQVEGLSWMDREWATNQLGKNQVGWDWFSIQLDDNSELMLYQMRFKGGGIDPESSGTMILADGTSQNLKRTDYRLTSEGGAWTSPVTGAKYPLQWNIEIPSHNLSLTLVPAMKDQEFAEQPIVYWEGAIRVTGTKEGKPIKGTGYLELTGYYKALKELGAK